MYFTHNYTRIFEYYVACARYIVIFKCVFVYVCLRWDIFQLLKCLQRTHTRERMYCDIKIVNTQVKTRNAVCQQMGLGFFFFESQYRLSPNSLFRSSGCKGGHPSMSGNYYECWYRMPYSILFHPAVLGIRQAIVTGLIVQKKKDRHRWLAPSHAQSSLD